jgi:shikimate kinase
VAASEDESVRRVVLLGAMGAGKTTVGALLARRLGWTHLDLDREIEKRERRPVAEIFRTDGEARFRALEGELTAELAGRTRLVISPGGGWITNSANLAALGPGTLSLWLRVSPETALQRIGAAPGSRPLLTGPDPLGAARRLLAERERDYALADAVVDTEEMSVAEVVEATAVAVLSRISIPSN